MTDLTRRSIVHAQEEARLLRHNYIGTEHALLGLLQCEGVASRALISLGVTADDVRGLVEEIIGVGSATPRGAIPVTPRAKRVLELAQKQAKSLGHNYLGTEHVLLGLVDEGSGVAVQVLDRLGLHPSAVRARTLEVMQSPRRQWKPEPRREAAVSEEPDPLGQILSKIERMDKRLDAIERQLGRGA